MRAIFLCCAAIVAAQTLDIHAQGDDVRPLSLLDVPFISQSEALCGGAAAAMVLRYWGERTISAETFAHLVDRSEAGIRTDALTGELQRRGWVAVGIRGDDATLRRELSQGRPVLTLIEDRPGTFHYIVILAWHTRGIVFHDPARGPFVVMSPAAFDRRWRQAGRWMAVVVPGEARSGIEATKTAPTVSLASASPNACEQAAADGVRHTQANNLQEAERVLAGAVDCPAAARELAGIRIIQKRWSEAEDLASTAIAAGDRDPYTWKVVATSRFVQNDRLGALDAWNQVGEPRVDLVRIDGLTRTRHRVAERLLDVGPGAMLTPDRLLKARRLLRDLPAASATGVDYVPVPSGLAELRAVVAERSVLPRGRVPLAAMALVAAATREVRVTTGSLTGGGESLSAAWRFWPERPRVSAGLHAPAPWGGTWGVDVFSDRQPFTTTAIPRAERAGATVDVGGWMTGRLHWSAAAGVDRWQQQATRGRVGGRVRFVSVDDRVAATFGATAWTGRSAFATTDGGIAARSSTELRGTVVRGSAHLQHATVRTPLDLWWAGDTGHARSTLMRAHPLLDGSRLRVDRLGRLLVHGSLEAQRWWSAAGPIRAAVALFGDAGRTGRRFTDPARTDLDVGLGARLAVTGVSGVFRVDLAQGLRDGATAVSVAYEP